ncbi:Ribonuclease H-like domain containing protein [Lactarius tabidus]
MCNYNHRPSKPPNTPPHSRRLTFHRSVDSDLASDLEACSNKVISITDKLLNLASTAHVRGEDDFINRFRSLTVEPMDQLFKRVDIALDQFSRRTKAADIAINPPESKKRAASKGRQEPVIQHVLHLPKPQFKSKRKVDSTNGVFNVRVPLGYTTRPPHLCRYEFNNLTYPTHMFISHPSIPLKPLEETPLTLVSTRAQLVDKLRESKVIAIDLECHSDRAYSGFVCLMHIGTRDEDWILHFNLYLVNLFDTFHASKARDFPRHGLAALLEMYCHFAADNDAFAWGVGALRAYAPDPRDAEGGTRLNGQFLNQLSV